MRYVSYILLYLSVFYGANAYARSWSIFEYPDKPYVAFDVPFMDDENTQRYLEDFEGDTVLLAFWATWCASCVQEMPSLDNLQKDFEDLDFAVLPISQDFQGVELISKFYDEYHLTHLPIYYDLRHNLFNEFDVVGLPTAFIIDGKGRKLYKIVGVVDWSSDEIREFILSVIPGQKEAPKNSSKKHSGLNIVPRSAPQNQHKASVSSADQAKQPQETVTNNTEYKSEAVSKNIVNNTTQDQVNQNFNINQE